MNSFEAGIDKDQFEHLALDRAFEKAKALIAEAEIKPAEFVGVYSEAEIQADEAMVAKLEKKFEEGDAPELAKKKKLATIFEAIVHEHAELSEWFGEDAETIKPSRFDDIKNGIDTIVELKEGNKSATHIAMGIDATFSHDVEDKFRRIQKEIEDGHLGEVKYFKSEEMGGRGRLINVPRVVIGADEQTIRELTNLWLNGQKRELGSHPIQFQILEEIADQLKAFKSFAEAKGKTNVAAMYEKMSRNIRDIRKKKGAGLIKDTGFRDTVFKTLEENLEVFTR